MRLPNDIPEPGANPVAQPPTLTALCDVPNSSWTLQTSHFASTIFVASTLGRIQRSLLQHHGASDPYPPWHARSEYMLIDSLLLSFEVYSDAIDSDMTTGLDRRYPGEGVVSEQRAGNFVFSIVLYHMNQCLLRHPFLLWKSLQTCGTRPPSSFLNDSRRRALEHAKVLSDVLRVIYERGMSITSFYGYACTVACTIFRLYMEHEDIQTASFAKHQYVISLEFLRRGGSIWAHYARMVSLACFPVCPPLRAVLTSSAT